MGMKGSLAFCVEKLGNCCITHVRKFILVSRFIFIDIVTIMDTLRLVKGVHVVELMNNVIKHTIHDLGYDAASGQLGHGQGEGFFRYTTHQ